MILKNKKGLNPITFLIMSLVVVVLLLILTVFLLQTTEVFIDEDKKNSQLINNQILNKNCFSERYGIIEREKFNQDSIDKCLEKFQGELIRVFLTDNRVFYFDLKEDEFLQRNSFCSYSTSCFENKFPIILIDDKNNTKIDAITIQIVN